MDKNGSTGRDLSTVSLDNWIEAVGVASKSVLCLAGMVFLVVVFWWWCFGGGGSGWWWWWWGGGVGVMVW